MNFSALSSCLRADECLFEVVKLGAQRMGLGSDFDGGPAKECLPGPANSQCSSGGG